MYLREIGLGGGGCITMPLNENENPHFDYEHVSM
jgi:hypothetical protein